MTRTKKYFVNRVIEPPPIAAVRSTPTAHGTISCWRKLEYLLLWTQRLLVGFITVYVCWICLRLEWNEVPWHALLCTLGFVLLMSEGIMAHYRSNAWTQMCERSEKTRTHWLLQLCGSVVGIAGIGIKVYLEDVHFYTTHGLCGLAALVVLLCSLGSGVFALFAHELRERFQPLISKALHNILGLLTFTLACLSMSTSFDTSIFMEHSLDATFFWDFHMLLNILIALIFVLTVYGPFWTLIYSKLWKCC